MSANDAFTHATQQEKPSRAGSPLSNQGARALHNAAATMALWPLMTQPLAWMDLLQMQQATLGQLSALQQKWGQDWGTLLRDCERLHRANTLSKLLEQQFNLLAQGLQLLGQQATDLADLEENVSVNYGHWASQRLAQGLTQQE